METVLTTKQKALRLNLDAKIFGTIAEIGAGQEVARNFFKAGGSSGTIAKTISAYDMSLSNTLYGEIHSKRYVSEERLKKMLEVEYSDLLVSVKDSHSSDTCYFAFANTVSAINFQKTNESHGWLGIKFQLNPNCEANEIVMHIKMYEKDNFLQQRTIGILGVNLIYAAYYFNDFPENFLRSLLDNLSRDQLEIDMIRMSGPELEYVDNRLISLQLVKNKITNVTVFDHKQHNRPPSDLFYKKNIMVLRGSFRPITDVAIDMLKTGFELFKKDANCCREDTLLFCEISIDNLMKEGDYDEKDFLDRVDLINGLGIDVILSDLKQHHEFVSYFDNFKIFKQGIIIGSSTYKELFNHKYYESLSGGTLQGFGRLFKQNVKMYVYPTIQEGTDELLTTENLSLDSELDYLHKYIVNAGRVMDIKNYRKDKLHIFSNTVLKYIQEANDEWENMVPKFVAKTIKAKKMFGLK